MMVRFKSINSDFIPILDWTLIKDDSDKKELYDLYQIESDFEIIYTDILGDIIAKKDSKLYSINHEEPESEPLLIVTDIIRFQKVVERLIKLPGYSTNTPLTDLRKIKKELTEIKKEVVKGLRENIEDTIDDLKELISDWKFYQTDEGKRYLSTESFKEEFYKKIQRPLKYRRIEVEREFESMIIKIIGVCEKDNETKEDLENMINKIECELPVEFGQLYTFEEYKTALEKRKLTNKH
jgi:hypothetical protein